MADPLTESQKQLEARGVPLTRAGELSQGLGALASNPTGLAIPLLLEKIYGSVRGEDGVAPTSILERLLGPSKELQGLGDLANTGGISDELIGIDFADLPGTGVGDPDIKNDTGLSSKPYPAHLSDEKAREQAKRMFLANRSSPSNYIAPDREQSSPEEIQALINNSSNTTANAGSEGGANNPKAEAFRKKESTLFDDQSMSIADSQKATEDMFKSSMDEFLGLARGASPDKRERTLEEYKKEFAAATGVDVSGKVDNSQALMAMGLALMQNRAGSGFNVGKILNAVGQAGEKALPALEKAKTEAKKAGLAAGQYALQSRNSDQAKDEADVEKGKQRSAFYIVPKGKGVSGFLANIDQGQLENLNPFELDALMSNESFQEKFDVVPGSTWSGIVEEAMKTKEAGVYWDTKAPRKIELFGEGAGDMFTIEAWRALPQSGKDNKLVGSGQDAYEGLARAARDMGKARDKFSSAFGLIEGTTAFRFTLDKVDSLAAAFGVNFKEGTNKTEKLKLFLTKLQAQNAKEILGEAGKTISDADRALVKTIVGDVDLFQNTELLEQKVNELFQEIIIKKEQNILDALTTLDRYSGRRIASRLDNGDLDEAGYAELQGYLASPAFEEN